VFLVEGAVDHRYNEIELMVDPYVAIAPAGAYPAGATVSLDDLAQQPLIGQPEHDWCHARVMDAMSAHGHVPHVVFRSADNATVQAMVRAGRGFAIQPHLCVEPSDPGVVLLSIDPPIPPRRIVLIWRDDPDVPPAIIRFVELAREVASQVSNELAALPA
jgi:DNA-binding transcriptional LysR family regulator